MELPSDTLLRPKDVIAATTTGGGTRGLSAEILSRAARRVRILALMYAFTFFMAAFLPNLLFERERAEMFANFVFWIPDVVAIVLGLVVAACTLNSRVPLPVIMNLSVGFLVVSSFGIAVAEYINPDRLDNNGWIGLSWVAVWTPLYTVVVPTRPSTALMATLASVSSVPLVIGWMVYTGRTTFQPDPRQFFFMIVFPYLLIVALSYAGQRVVYALAEPPFQTPRQTHGPVAEPVT